MIKKLDMMQIPPEIAHISPTLVSFANRECDRVAVRQLLTILIKEHGLIEQIAQRSYLHQLGFEKYVLFEFPSGRQVRLHYWRENSCREDVHSHCSAFTSTVLAGGFQSEEFVLKKGKSYWQFLYRFNAVANLSEFECIGLTDLQSSGMKCYREGDNYSLAAGTLHRVLDALPGTLTLSVWDVRNDDALVIKCDRDIPADCKCSSGMDVGDVLDRFSEMIIKL